MQAYCELTDAGKLRRLHSLAVVTLSRFSLRIPEIRYHCFDTNLLYRVTEQSGQRYILRLACPGWRTIEDLQSEAMWLVALARDTDIRSPHFDQRDGLYCRLEVSPMTQALRDLPLVFRILGWAARIGVIVAGAVAAAIAIAFFVDAYLPGNLSSMSTHDIVLALLIVGGFVAHGFAWRWPLVAGSIAVGLAVSIAFVDREMTAFIYILGIGALVHVVVGAKKAQASRAQP